MKSWFFAARLAARQLIDDKPKLIAALLGVLFACVLVFMQLGFRDSLMQSAASAPIRMQADLFLLHPQTEGIWRTVEFPRTWLMRTLGAQNVKQVEPMYLGMGQFKNIDTKINRTLMVYAFNPKMHLMNIPGISAFTFGLLQENTVVFDRASRPEFGDVETQVARGDNQTEINNHRVRILGTIIMGTSFAADGNVITSDLNYFRLFPHRSIDKIDVGLIQVKDPSEIANTQKQLKALFKNDLMVMTYDEMIAHEKNYWENSAPIGFIFGMGVVMGLVVGMVIVYQILFTDISNHLSQYATLKAMGYTQGYLIKVVFASAAYLAIIGFVPGLLISLYLYHVAESNIFIEFPMPLSKITLVFSLILGMCFLSGALAIRKLRSANPADMF